MVGAKAAVAALLVASLLAGCVSEKNTDSLGRSRDAQSGAIAALGGRQAGALEPSAEAAAPGAAGNATAAKAPAAFEVLPQVSSTDSAPWYVASMEVPAGTTAIAGYRWTVPEGSVQESEDYNGVKGVSLEAAFLVPQGAKLGGYSVSWFVIRDGTPTLLSVQLGIPFEAVVKFTPATATPETLEPSMDPVFLYFDSPQVKDGTELGIVISAQGQTEAFGFAWRVLDHNIQGAAEDPASGTQAFVKQVAALGPGLSMQPVATGSGFQASVYIEVNLGFLLGFEVKGGAIKVEDRLATAALRPVASVRDMTLSNSFNGTGDSGWGIGAFVYLTGAGAAPWKLQGDLHGQALDQAGAAVSVVSYPAIEVFGDEAPSSDVALGLTVASADYIELLQFFTLDYGASISHLLGSEPPLDRFAVAAAQEVQVEAQGRDLVLTQADGMTVTLLGALPEGAGNASFTR